MVNPTRNATQDQNYPGSMPYDNDLNVVEIWTRIDPVRWFAGAIAGVVAGGLSLFFAMFLSVISGRDIWFPAKLLATTVLGASATALDAGAGAILVGVLVYEGICTFWGVVYAHFTGTNSIPSLLAMGLAWSAWHWVFTWCLFLQSFRTIFIAVSTYTYLPVLFICLVYGLSMSTVSFFDQMLRGPGKSPGQ